jgi:hypothetical protein
MIRNQQAQKNIFKHGRRTTGSGGNAGRHLGRVTQVLNCRAADLIQEYWRFRINERTLACSVASIKPQIQNFRPPMKINCTDLARVF